MGAAIVALLAVPTVIRPIEDNKGNRCIPGSLERRDLLVCDDRALDVYTDQVLGDAESLALAPFQREYRSIRRVSCGELNQGHLCHHGANSRAVSCEPGHVVLALRDGPFDEGHADETLIHMDVQTGEARWAVILLPSTIFGAGQSESARVHVVAHAMLHADCIGHAVRPIGAGLALSDPADHLMSPSIQDHLGTDTQGIADAYAQR